MERRVMGNYHARCGAGEKPEVVTPEAYLSLFTNTSSSPLRMEIIILHYGKTEIQSTIDLKSKVRNLSAILGKDKLIKLTANNLVHFIDASKLDEIETIIYESKKRTQINTF
ncbi:MAG: hypothetical protein MSE70_09070 [Streptococcus sp.]|uniref:hypothetical protein n=1 Tax=Streptococcus sp. TaxID=1306 RepID=UPI002587DD12|nr:hypothetical protein [Streptococcus sp.]MCI7517168.1 hypothetical protein [Streptococcus sp.]MDY5269412.1 hypothetical protein [Streptococcus sp.]